MPLSFLSLTVEKELVQQPQEEEQKQQIMTIKKNILRLKKRVELEPLYSDACSRDLRITGVSKRGSSWQYHIEILDIRSGFPKVYRDNNNQQDSTQQQQQQSLPTVVRYSVERRYNDFRQLYAYLLETQTPEFMENLPNFPEGGFVSYLRSDDPKLLQYRKEQLQRFLRALDEHPYTKWSSGFMNFLKPKANELDEWSGLLRRTNSSRNRMNQLSGNKNVVVPAAPASAPAASTSTGNNNLDFSMASLESSFGYVSLSCVRSPEIRFRNRKHVEDARGDWKKRKLRHHTNNHKENHQDHDQLQQHKTAATVRGQQPLYHHFVHSRSNELHRLLSLEAPM